MHPLRGVSVRFKVSGAIALVVIAVVLFQITYFPARQIELLTAAVEAKALALGRLAATDVKTGLEFDDKEPVKETLKRVGEDADVLYAVLAKESGEVFAAYDPRGMTASIRFSAVSQASVERGDDVVRALVPVLSQAGTRGVLTVALSTARIQSEAEGIRRTAILIGLVIVVLGLLIALVAGTSLGRRLAQLQAIADRVSRGELKGILPVDDDPDEIGMLSLSFAEMVRGMRELETHVRDVAAGNLSQTTAREGDLALAFNAMIIAQRELVTQIASTAVQLNGAAGEFLANAKQQERGATEQSSAVDQTRQTIDGLRGNADQIAHATGDVLENAERAQQNAQVVNERIVALSQHTHRIAEILEVIKGIANKSDLLALNAALEGTKAGEAGRGFSLVATQMQRLAESVMRSVADIKELTGNVTDATQATVIATELSTRLAADTTRSARQIGTFSAAQLTGAEQATSAMHDVAKVAMQTASGSKDIVESATDLIKLSSQLQGLVGRFRVDGSASLTGRRGDPSHMAGKAAGGEWMS